MQVESLIQKQGGHFLLSYQEARRYHKHQCMQTLKWMQTANCDITGPHHTAQK